MNNYLDMTILEIHEALLNNKVTPLELVKIALSRAKQDTNNAFEYISEKEALEMVAHLDEAKKSNLLWGIPFVLKDNFSTKDIPTTGSSNILDGYKPVFNSEVYQRLIDQGAILIGKTTLDELGMGGTGSSGHLGKTFNPWDKKHQHQVGGSSCGSASATCSGIVPLGIGSDTGDSVRKPASNAGLVGFKPTWGLISRYGLIPFAQSLDHVAYFTRSVKDSALVLDILQGRDEKDATSASKPLINHLDNITSNINGKRIAVIDEILESVSNQTIKATFLNTLDALKAKGAIINHVSLDKKICDLIYPTYIIISGAESSSNNANLNGISFGSRTDGKTYEEMVKNTRTTGFSEKSKRRMTIGGFVLRKENYDDLYVKAQKIRHLIVNKVNEILKDNDIIYLPASSDIAPIFDDVEKPILSNQQTVVDNHLVLGNFAGLPSLTLPIGFDKGLPFGANFMGKAFDEITVFDFSLALEDITGLKNLQPKENK